MHFGNFWQSVKIQVPAISNWLPAEHEYKQMLSLLSRRFFATIKTGQLFYHPQTLKDHFKGFRGGGVRSVDNNAVTKYCNYIKLRAKHDQKTTEMVREVRELQNTVYSDPVIRMCLQGSLDYMVKNNDPSTPLYGLTIDEVMWQINTVATSPPVFSNAEIIGVPFSILFFGLLNNYYGQGFFSNPKVNIHLKRIFDVYGTLLHSQKSQASLNRLQNGWLSSDRVDYKDFFLPDPNDERFYGFKNWNEWFVRHLAPGARPVDERPQYIVNSSDSYCLPSPTQPVRNVQALNSFWLKDDNYSLYDMFGVNRMGPEVKRIVDESFVGGTVYQAFLSPWCYHRWHAPYSGTIEQTYKLNGTYLLENPTSDLSQSGEDNYVNTQPLLTSLSVRHVYILNTEDPLIGRIGVIEIGMGEVSSCISTVNPGDYMKKGQELGRFEFGGSSHALIFDRRANLEFNPRIYETDAEGPVLQKVNSWLARIKPSTK